MLPEDLNPIVLLSGLETQPKPVNKPTALKTVAYQGELYKVRKYATASDAQRQQQLLNVVNGLFTRCYGRLNNFLVLQYLDMASQPHNSKDYLVEMGAFLSELAGIESKAPAVDEFDSSVEDLSSGGLILPATIELIKRYHRKRILDTRISWGLEYFDAMPRNFVFHQDKLVSIDEKHLRIGPKGVSLIKPMWELSDTDFASVLECYEARTGWSGFQDAEYREFLIFYYIVYGLAFVGKHKSKTANIRIRQFHRRRHQLLKIVGASMGVRLREEAWWLLLYRGYRIWAILRRVSVSIVNAIGNFQRIQPDAQT